ncbi:MAG: hypothetical protein LBH65_04245, partial [Desulfovibrio sp.]|nr:hypothetical protein [Desulfovibrio sp.]
MASVFSPAGSAAAIGAVGVFFGLPNPVFHLPPLVLLYPCCLFLLAGLADSSKKACLYGFCAGLPANAAGLYWLIFPMRDVAGIPFVLAAPTALLLHAYLALFAALFVLAAYRLQRFFRTFGGLTALLAPPLLAGLLFGGCEVLRGTLFTGFPWLLASCAFAFWPAWIQAASLVGA